MVPVAEWILLLKKGIGVSSVCFSVAEDLCPADNVLNLGYLLYSHSFIAVTGHYHHLGLMGDRF